MSEKGDEAVLSEEMRRFLEEKGAALVGFADMSGVPGCNFPRAVSVVLPIPKDIAAELKVGPTAAYREVYKDLNKRLDRIVTEGGLFLRERGYRAQAQTLDFVEKDLDYDDHSNSLCTEIPHKTAAARAGLGWIGKSCLLVTREFGSAVRISTILTDAPLECGQPITRSRCGSCDDCCRACPGGALSGKLWDEGVGREEIMDIWACSEAMARVCRERGVEGAICGKCFAVCPYTERYVGG